MVSAGKLIRKVLIEYKTQLADAYGSLVDTWGTHATWWAAIIPVTGREYVSDGKVNSEVTTRMRGRYLNGITPIMRVKYGTRIFSIVAVINIDERNREIEILAKEII